MTTTPEPELRVLSLGAGVQSTVLALMACDGQLPGLDAAIFADTGWEPPSVYEQVERLRAEFERAGITFYQVSSGNIRDDAVDPEHRFVSVPWHTLMPEGTMVDVTIECDACEGTGTTAGAACPMCDGDGRVPTGEKRLATYRERQGMGRRQCTSEYKAETD